MISRTCLMGIGGLLGLVWTLSLRMLTPGGAAFFSGAAHE